MVKFNANLLQLRIGALLLSLTAWAGAVSLTASGEYLGDNTVFSRRTVSLDAGGIALPFGSLAFRSAYSGSTLAEDINGLRAFDDASLSGSIAYRCQHPSFLTGADFSAGTGLPGGRGRSFVAGSIPFEWRFTQPGLRLMSSLRIRKGTAEDNPVTTRIGIDKRTLKADAGIGWKGWEIHAAYQQEKYSDIRRADYQPLLADTAFFQVFYDILNPFLKFINTPTNPFPANEINEFSVYGFGPISSLFYAGASYVSGNADHNFYLPVADKEDGRIVNAYFPYITPRDERVLSLIGAFARQWETAGAIINNLSVKLDFPAYSASSYRGYYQVNPQNLLEGLQGFFYDYFGLGTLAMESEIGKNISKTWRFSLNYKWFSRPYRAYRYFGNDSYQYHTAKIAITKEL